MIITFIIILVLYRRYAPIGQAFCQLTGQEILLDVGNYQTVFKDPVDNAIKIPYGYLKRYFKEIPNKKIIIIAEDYPEKNLAIRFLHQKGYQVKEYIIIDGERENAQSLRCLNKCLHE
ncbi:hypothetical protein [Heyndrickxia acidicola]|uniref:Sulfurtransferase n=1 Tax=Heyndrickxia acidicola TaxID=209389 RepID=A0ABU6MGY2_9BACI|nr:hypothetical protein [Heyndrickxia acidicola]MED1203933.1 sulfurtransferase [Heyndrickxia acidicola]